MSSEPQFHLAQVNIGRARGETTEPVMAGFMARLADINALAERTPGFIWRLQTDEGDATALRPYGDPRIMINMSVWADLDALRTYVYRSAHAEVMRRRKEWFERFERAYMVLWWVPVGHVPTIAEALDRLAHLEQHGPTSAAFTFTNAFDPDGATIVNATRDDPCPA